MTKALISLRGDAGWSAPLLFTNPKDRFSRVKAHIIHFWKSICLLNEFVICNTCSYTIWLVHLYKEIINKLLPVDKHGITILYHLYQCNLALHTIFCAKVCKGGVNVVIPWVVRLYVEIIQKALASGLSCVQVDKHDITVLYHLQLCRPCTSQDILC